MSKVPLPISPQEWMRRLFASQAAVEGAAVRRKIRDIERYAGREVFVFELRRCGYHAVENARQMVMFCNQEPIRRVLQPFSERKRTGSFS